MTSTETRDHPPPDSSSSAASSAAATSSAAKLPSRPRKLRKLSPDSSSSAAAAAIAAPLRSLPRPLTAPGEISAALRHLRAADPALVPLIDAHDPPTFLNFHPPFHTLARYIINQQLSFKAASAAYSAFVALCGGDDSAVSPAAVLQLPPERLRQIGVSARKAGYLRDLARKFHTGVLSDEGIAAMDDRSLLSMLTMVEGIGAWSAHMFMIFSLHRPDVLPVGDAGVRKGVQILYGLEEVPRPSQMERLCERWRPYRSVGSWYMWRLSEAKAAAVAATGGGGGGGGEVHHQEPPLMLDTIQVER